MFDIESMIKTALEAASPEQKASLRKINEFMPLIEAYHNMKPLDKEKGELGVSYLVRFENGGIILYQVVLASKANVENGKPFVSRQLERWNVTEKLNEITNNL